MQPKIQCVKRTFQKFAGIVKWAKSNGKIAKKKEFCMKKNLIALKTLAVAAVLWLALAFAGCSNGSDSSPYYGNNGVSANSATFISSAFYGGTIKIEYKSDGTYLMTWTLASITTNKGKGTYTLS